MLGNKRLRILLVGDYPNDPRLGSSKVPHKLREEFLSRGHHCRLLFREDIGQRPEAFRARALVAPTMAARAVAAAYRADGGYDVIDIASGEGFVVGLQHAVGAYAKTALISRSHGLEHVDFQRTLDDHHAGLQHKSLAGRIWSPMIRLPQVAGSARLADRFLVLNEGDRAYAIQHRWKPPFAVHVVPHGVSTRLLESAPDSTASRGGGILFASTWTIQKGVHYLARAFSALAESGRCVNLTLIGDSGQESTIRAAFSLSAQAYLTIVPRASEDKLIALYRSHDIMVMASTYEGFGMVLLEAMSQGLATIATPVGSAPSLIRDGATGILVPIRDSDALAGALRRLIDNPEERRRLGRAAREAVRTMTWSAAADQTLAVYEDALSGQHHGRSS